MNDEPLSNFIDPEEVSQAEVEHWKLQCTEFFQTARTLQAENRELRMILQTLYSHAVLAGIPSEILINARKLLYGPAPLIDPNGEFDPR